MQFMQIRNYVAVWGAILQDLHHGDVVDGPGVLSHLLQAKLPKHPSLHSVAELIIELLQPP
jgi:hypothetical protein